MKHLILVPGLVVASVFFFARFTPVHAFTTSCQSSHAGQSFSYTNPGPTDLLRITFFHSNQTDILDCGGGVLGFDSGNNAAFCDYAPGVFPASTTRVVTQTQDFGTVTCTYGDDAAPVMGVVPSANVVEGATASIQGTFSDSDSTSWTGTVDYGDGSGSQVLQVTGSTTYALSHVYHNDGSYSVNITLTDNQGLSSTTSTSVIVTNAAPVVNPITAPTTQVPVNTSINAVASFTDPGVSDTHTASWDWGDGSTSTGVVSESGGSGQVSGTHSFTTAGVYTLALTVTDNEGLSSTQQFQYVVVFDPTMGAVNGQGKYGTNGDVKFGIQAKYKKDSTIPSGKLKIDSKSLHMDVDLSSYNWLVISGSKATLQGTGTINDTGSFTILVSMIDGGSCGKQNDFIRVKITDNVSQAVVYDTQAGASDTADPTTALTRGSIEVR